MIRNSSHTQGTSTADLIHLQTTSTSTSDFFTSSHVATQTEERPTTLTPPHLSRSLQDRHGQTSGDDVGTGTESDSSDEEEEASEGEATDEETSPKHRILEEEQQRRRDDEEETSSIRLVSSVENIRVTAEESSREAPAAGITLPAADKVEIIQNQKIINKTYLVGCFDFNWAAFLEEKISEQFSRAQQRQERHCKSMERSLKKEIKECKSTLKEYMRKLLRSQATDDKAQIEQLQQQVAQLREDIDKKQQERTELEKQTFDQLAKLGASQEEAMKKEKEGKRFVFSLGGKHKRVFERVWTGMEQSQMVQLMKRLYQKFQIKLRQVAVHCGMQFVLDVPTENAEALEEQQAAIQEAILEEIVPEDFQGEVEWEAPVPLAGECELNPPVQVSEVLDDDDLVEDRGTSDQGFVPAAQESSMAFDPTTAVLESSSQSEIPTTITEVENCRTTSLLVTKSRLLICTDFHAKKVTCTLLDSQCTSPETSFGLDAPPWDLAIFVNDVIAVASNTNVILLLAVKRHDIRLLKPVETVRRYIGVTSFGDGDILVVSSLGDSLGPALIDVITDGGTVLWRVADRNTLPQLLFPACLHMQNRDVLVSDKNGLIHRVDYSLKTPRPALCHPDLKSPGQVTTDSQGLNVFVSSCQNKCVLVYSMTSRQWRTLLTGAEHGERGRDTPQAVGVTEDGMVVVAWDEDEDRTEVIVYPGRPEHWFTPR